jgi:hypothetical protein
VKGTVFNSLKVLFVEKGDLKYVAILPCLHFSCTLLCHHHCHHPLMLHWDGSSSNDDDLSTFVCSPTSTHVVSLCTFSLLCLYIFANLVYPSGFWYFQWSFIHHLHFCCCQINPLLIYM